MHSVIFPEAADAVRDAINASGVTSKSLLESIEPPAPAFDRWPLAGLL
jgi:hypothetical protein